jgi:transposase
MKAYSVDLRQKIIDVRQSEHLSIRALAQRFRVSKNFIENLLKRHRENGSVQPRPHGGGARPKLNIEQLNQLEALVEKHNDATLAELGEMLHQGTGIRLSITTLSTGQKL